MSRLSQVTSRNYNHSNNLYWHMNSIVLANSVRIFSIYEQQTLPNSTFLITSWKPFRAQRHPLLININMEPHMLYIYSEYKGERKKQSCLRELCAHTGHHVWLKQLWGRDYHNYKRVKSLKISQYWPAISKQGAFNNFMYIFQLYFKWLISKRPSLLNIIFT